MTNLASKAVVVGVVAAAIVGCNAILDNQSGDLVVTDEAGTLATGPLDAGSSVDSAVPIEDDAGDHDASAPPSGDCPKGQRVCDGVCVANTDPVYGCGDPACAPCPGEHATFGCQGNQCAITACDPGYANCNAQPTDGCETDLSKPETCGACNATCGAATPLCAATGTTFGCTNGCTPDTPVNCGNACVDPNRNVDDCGGCNIECPAVANATATCTAGVCGAACKPFFHACDGKCPAVTDPTACGPDCKVCPVPPGGVATCILGSCGTKCTAPSHECAGACVANDVAACGAACTPCVAPANATATCNRLTCGFTCTAGFADCDGNAANGCEIDLQTDAANCGKCGAACPLLTHCAAGTCKLL